VLAFIESDDIVSAHFLAENWEKCVYSSQRHASFASVRVLESRAKKHGLCEALYLQTLGHRSDGFKSNEGDVYC
jgi:hypothetical protein